MYSNQVDLEKVLLGSREFVEQVEQMLCQVVDAFDIS